MTRELSLLHAYILAGLTQRKWHKYLLDQKISYGEAYEIIVAEGFDEAFPKIDWQDIRYTLQNCDNKQCTEKLSDSNICLYGYQDLSSPFMQLSNPPFYLYTHGDISLLHQQHKGVVGSRRPQRYTVSCLKAFLNTACANQNIMVSGCASGVDACVHTISLQYNIPTIMVLGSGHHATSYSKKKLIQSIYTSKGCVISEYPPDFEATKYSFPKRNRLIAALSRELYVFQAQEKSGSLITAKHAKQLGIPLKVLPGQVGESAFGGSHQLISDGADIFFDMTSFPSEQSTHKTSKQFDTPLQEILYTTLVTPILLDNLYHKHTKYLQGDIDHALFSLELRGYITQEAGIYSLAI